MCTHMGVLQIYNKLHQYSLQNAFNVANGLYFFSKYHVPHAFNPLNPLPLGEIKLINSKPVKLVEPVAWGQNPFKDAAKPDEPVEPAPAFRSLPYTQPVLIQVRGEWLFQICFPKLRA